MKFLVIFLCALVMQAYAENEDLKKLQTEMNQKLDVLVNPQAFKDYIQNNPKLFPGVSVKNPMSIVVQREDWKMGEEKFVMSNGYRQILILSKNIKFLKDMWISPEFYSRIYQLDKDAVVPGVKNTPTRFQARIYKKVPIVADQDYTLDYEVTDKKNEPYFVRARLVKDNGGFALRDNFKVLEETPDGMLITVIDFIYPLSSIVRALGPAVRQTLRDELRKLNELEKCFTEKSSSFPPLEETYKLCHELIKPKKQSSY